MCRPNFRAMRSLQVRRRRTDVVHRAEVDRMQSLPTGTIVNDTDAKALAPRR